MRRSNLGLALASSAVAVALVVLIYGIDSQGIDSQRSSRTAVEPRLGEANQARQTSPIGTELNKSTEVVQSLSSDGSQERIQANQGQPSTVIFSRGGGIADEDSTRVGVRKIATREIRRRYSLLLQDLDLTPREREALFALLVEDWITSTSTPYQHGETIDKEEQSSRIVTIIGDRKQQEFSELESNVDAYTEVQKIGSLFRTNGVPLTDAQRGGLLKIIAETQNEYLRRPIANVDGSAIEFVELQQTQIADYERHLMELVSSVLSAQQVVYLDDQIHYFAYSRADALERQRQELADGTRADDSPPPSFPIWASEEYE